MKFKVGQRVRVVCIDDYGPVAMSCIGREGTVTGGSVMCGGGVMREYKVSVDGIEVAMGFDGRHLTPLTDPGFESFMERIQKPLTKPEWEAA